MYKLVRAFNVLLILSILWVYQTNTLHFEHIFEEDSHCDICITKDNISDTHHQISYVVDSNLFENIIVRNRLIPKTDYKFTQDIVSKEIDFEGLRYFTVSDIPLGYFSNAPPLFS